MIEIWEVPTLRKAAAMSRKLSDELWQIDYNLELTVLSSEVI